MYTLAINTDEDEPDPVNLNGSNTRFNPERITYGFNGETRPKFHEALPQLFDGLNDSEHGVYEVPLDNGASLYARRLGVIGMDVGMKFTDQNGMIKEAFYRFIRAEVRDYAEFGDTVTALDDVPGMLPQEFLNGSGRSFRLLDYPGIIIARAYTFLGKEDGPPLFANPSDFFVNTIGGMFNIPNSDSLLMQQIAGRSLFWERWEEREPLPVVHIIAKSQNIDNFADVSARLHAYGYFPASYSSVFSRRGFPKSLQEGFMFEKIVFPGDT